MSEPNHRGSGETYEADQHRGRDELVDGWAYLQWMDEGCFPLMAEPVGGDEGSDYDGWDEE